MNGFSIRKEMHNSRNSSPEAVREIPWHSLTKQEILDGLNSDEGGLSDSDAQNRQAIHGKNELRRAARHSPIATFARQFASPLIIILLAATAISAFLGEMLDAVIIMVIVVLAAAVSFVQEYRSEKAIEALRQITSPTSVVIRNRRPKTIRSEDIVPGDIIVLAQGDKLPADGYILESHSLQTNEAALTGESMPVEKSNQPCKPETPLHDRTNIVYSGTSVTLGRGKAAVFAIGHSTELGKIATSVESVERQKTPFEIRMSQIGKMLSVVMLAVVAIIVLLGIYRGHLLADMLVWGMSVAVAAIPEALPAVIATSLTLGVYKMAKRNAIVRRLPAVETLGGVTVICSDKTGTLTTGKMAVRKIYVNRSVIGVESEQLPDMGLNKSAAILMARAAALCNDAVLTSTASDEASRSSDSRIPEAVFGDPTEVAIATFAIRLLELTKGDIDSQFPRQFEIPFSSERKMMTTVHSMPDQGKMIVISKGAPETIIGICKEVLVDGQKIGLNMKAARDILEINDSFAADALRVLGISYKEMGADLSDLRSGRLTGELEKDHVFLGLLGLMDPPRLEAVEAIEQCKAAGILVTMITGDNKVTAEAIAMEIGIIDGARAGVQQFSTLTGVDIDKMSDDELNSALLHTRIFARVLPEHKLRITRSFQRNGHVVALTGDGVNDSPALKAADIGIAMGLTGTQVAKESSSMILGDDNFATIVSAIEEGRRIIDNVKKYLVYLLSANIGEIILFLSAVVIGLPAPLLAKHILYVNLATDGSPAVALGTEPAEPDIMKRPSQDPRKGVFAGTLVWLVGVSLILGMLSLALFWHIVSSGGWTDEAVSKARTMTFGLIIFFEIFFAYSSRSYRNSFWRMGVLRNKAFALSIVGELALALAIMSVPALRNLFSLSPLTVMDWLFVIGLALAGFAYAETAKIVMAAKAGKRANHPKRG